MKKKLTVTDGQRRNHSDDSLEDEHFSRTRFYTLENTPNVSIKLVEFSNNRRPIYIVYTYIVVYTAHASVYFFYEQKQITQITLHAEMLYNTVCDAPRFYRFVLLHICCADGIAVLW